MDGGQAGESRCAAVLPHGRFLRALLRRRGGGEPRIATDADRARSRTADAHVRRALSLGGGLPHTAAAPGIPHRNLRADGGPKAHQEDCAARGHRVLSPGTALDAALGQEQNNFLAAYFEMPPTGSDRLRRQDERRARCTPCTRIALLDVSTGEFRTAEFAGPNARSQAVDAILMAGASEVLLATSAEIPAGLERMAARTRVEDWVWTRDFAVPLVERQLKVRSLEGFGLVGHDAGGDRGGRGAALRAHDAEERGAAHRFAAVPGALDGART